MRRRNWSSEPAESQLAALCADAGEVGVLVVRFTVPAAAPPVEWRWLEPWTRTRTVTVADVRAPLAGGPLEVALLADLVVLRQGATLELPGPSEIPSAGLIWALGRAGRAALAAGLLMPTRLEPTRAVELGLAQAVLGVDEPLPIPGAASVTVLTAARDLARAEMSGSAGRGLEHATFRFLFAAGDPEEGARAFLDKREPRFARIDDNGDSDPGG